MRAAALGLGRRIRAAFVSPRQLNPARSGTGITVRGIDTSALRPMVPRSMLDWTPDDLRGARALADAGNLRLAADLWEEILGDDRASSVVRTRVLAIIGAGVR